VLLKYVMMLELKKFSARTSERNPRNPRFAYFGLEQSPKGSLDRNYTTAGFVRKQFDANEGHTRPTGRKSRPAPFDQPCAAASCPCPDRRSRSLCGSRSWED